MGILVRLEHGYISEARHGYISEAKHGYSLITTVRPENMHIFYASLQIAAVATSILLGSSFIYH
jgi:hypothetical protein